MLLFLRLSPDSTYVADILPGIMLDLDRDGPDFVPLTLIATSGVPVDDAGLASGLFNTSQQIGGALGLALLSTFAANKTDRRALLARPRPTPAETAQALVDGFHVAWIGCAAFLAAGGRAAVRGAPAPRRRPRRRRTARPSRSPSNGLEACPDRRRVRQPARVAFGRIMGCVPDQRSMEPSDALERGRASYAARTWGDAYDGLALADRETVLEPLDLELLATAAYMLGRDDEWMAVLERAHRRYADAGQPTPRRALRGLDRRQPLTARRDGAGHGLARAGTAPARERGGTASSAATCPDPGRVSACRDGGTGKRRPRPRARPRRSDGASATRISFALATHAQGQEADRRAAGSPRAWRSSTRRWWLLTTSELSPIVSGLVYCGVILACQEVVRGPPRPGNGSRLSAGGARASRTSSRSPTAPRPPGRDPAARRRLERRVARGRGAAGERLAAGFNQAAAADALYRQAELHRLRGESTGGRATYREASRFGFRAATGPRAAAPLPGARRGGGGDDPPRAWRDDGAAPTRRASSPAAVDILLAVEDVDAAASRLRRARGAGRPRSAASSSGKPRLHARGRSRARRGARPARALVSRRGARDLAGARGAVRGGPVRELVGLACRALGDEDTATSSSTLPRACSRGSVPDRDRRSGRVAPRPLAARDRHGLTPREHEVLRLLAAGKTNKAIAERARPERTDGRPAREQHLREAPRLLPRRRRRPTRMSTSSSDLPRSGWVDSPTAVAARGWVLRPKRSTAPP